jgi:hypothetical protein
LFWIGLKRFKKKISPALAEASFGNNRDLSGVRGLPPCPLARLDLCFLVMTPTQARWSLPHDENYAAPGV